MSKLITTLVVLALAVTAFAAGRYTAPPVTSFVPTTPLPMRHGAPTGALGEALREPVLLKRIEKLSRLLPTLGPEAVAEVEGALNTRGLWIGRVDRILLLHFWAQHQPEAAVKWAYGKGMRGLRASSLEVSVQAWAEADPPAAAFFLSQAPPPSADSARIVARALTVGWFRSGVPGLEAYIRSMEPGVMQQRALTSHFQELILRDGTEGAIAWAEALPDQERMDEKYKLAAYRRLMSELASNDLEVALAWCDEQCDGPFGDSLRTHLARVWTSYDPAAVLRWLEGEPAGEETDRAVVSAFETWALYDRDALAHYMAGLTDKGVENVPRFFHPVADPYALWISWDHPVEALMWAELIEPELKRRTTMVTITRRWLHRDESAAEAWIEQSSLTEDEQERARTFPPNWKRRSMPVPEA